MFVITNLRDSLLAYVVHNLGVSWCRSAPPVYVPRQHITKQSMIRSISRQLNADYTYGLPFSSTHPLLVLAKIRRSTFWFDPSDHFRARCLVYTYK